MICLLVVYHDQLQRTSHTCGWIVFTQKDCHIESWYSCWSLRTPHPALHCTHVICLSSPCMIDITSVIIEHGNIINKQQTYFVVKVPAKNQTWHDVHLSSHLQQSYCINPGLGLGIFESIEILTAYIISLRVSIICNMLP